MILVSEHDVFLLVAQLGIILFFARVFAELAIKFGQPIIVGEVIAGIILGPSVFGQFFPTWHQSLFPPVGPVNVMLHGLSWLCVLFLLLITGLEVDLRAALHQGKSSILISIFAMFFCFASIYGVTYFLPAGFMPAESKDLVHVRILVALALSVVAIPVIAKILFDLKILQSEVGVKILTSGILSDIWGWSLLATVVALVHEGSWSPLTVMKPILTMIIYLAVTLTLGHRLVSKLFDWFGYKSMDTTVLLSLLFSLTLLNGAIAHVLGIHVIFGAFISGIMVGECRQITPYIRQWTQDFIFAVFAPVFFVIIGMQMDFSSGISWLTVMILLVVSSVFRIAGAYLGSILGGLGRKNAIAVALGLNTQGTMGIIIGLVGYELHLFNAEMFSTIVIVCVVTSVLVGPFLKWAIGQVRRPLANYFDPDHVFLDVEASDKNEVIEAMTHLMAENHLIEDQSLVRQGLWDRELTLSTAVGDGVAVPHARIPNQREPILCFFRLKTPVDFGSPDNKPVELLFLELTDDNDDGMQLNLLAQVAKIIATPETRQRLLDCEQKEHVHQIMSLDDKA